jgi:hypothetical protein
VLAPWPLPHRWLPSLNLAQTRSFLQSLSEEHVSHSLPLVQETKGSAKSASAMIHLERRIGSRF